MSTKVLLKISSEIAAAAQSEHSSAHRQTAQWWWIVHARARRSSIWMGERQKHLTDHCVNRSLWGEHCYVLLIGTWRVALLHLAGHHQRCNFYSPALLLLLVWPFKRKEWQFDMQITGVSCSSHSRGSILLLSPSLVWWSDSKVLPC